MATASVQVERMATTAPTAVRRPAEPATIVIFGATGDLTAHKLMPSLFGLFHDSLLPERFSIVGVGRRDKTDAQFRDELRPLAETTCRLQPPVADAWTRFAARLFYHRCDFTRAEEYPGLKKRLEALNAEHRAPGNTLYYLATDPDFFRPIVEHLSKAGLVRRDVQQPWSRIVLEKPFGKDLASGQELDRDLHHFLWEDQIYRIDHYLGKDTVQNLLSFRFGNAIWEPLFNRGYIDHVQLTVAETVGMEGRRGAYYDNAGALRDVLQNHLLQLLALVAMEPPARLTAKEMRDEKVKVLRSLVPFPVDGAASLGQWQRDGQGNGASFAKDVERWVVRGQYVAGQVSGKPVRAYRDEEAVVKDSSTDTYVAMRVGIDNWRWAGVPFLLRTGKRLAKRVTEVAVHFKSPPSQLFAGIEGDGHLCDQARRLANVLVFRIQPDEGISLSFAAKSPGMQLDLHPVLMNFRYDETFDGCLPAAYERLLLDALRGDAALFMRSDEVEMAWQFVTPILEAWKSSSPPDLANYAAGSWGPKEADRLTDGCQTAWRQP